MSLPTRVIDRLFDRLALTYGSQWLSMWQGSDLNDIKSLWGAELAPFADRLEAIGWALENPPERPAAFTGGAVRQERGRSDERDDGQSHGSESKGRESSTEGGHSGSFSCWCSAANFTHVSRSVSSIALLTPSTSP